MVAQVFLEVRTLTATEREVVDRLRHGKNDEFEEILQRFMESSEQSLAFPASLTNQQRSVVHNIAGDLGLNHISVGSGASRHLVVSKKSSEAPASPPHPSSSSSASSPSRSSSSSSSASPKSPSQATVDEVSSLFHELAVDHPRVKSEDPNTVVEYVYYKGYIGFSGDLIDAIAASDSIYGLHAAATADPSKPKPVSALVPNEYRTRRSSRDGTQRHHITLITKAELALLSTDGLSTNGHRDVLKQLAEKVKDDWKDLGLGRVTTIANNGTEEAFFRLIEWPSAQTFRKELGLPEKDFHVTIGFKVNDIHDQVKDVNTLVFKGPKDYWSL